MKINDPQGAAAFTGMGHIVASFSDSRPRASTNERAGKQVFNAPVVIVSGGQANIAWDGGSTNTQNVAPITEGFEDVARALTQALELVVKVNDIEDDEREVADEAAKAALNEITNPKPDRKLIKRALAVLRGVLTSSAEAASAAATKALVQSLMIN